MKLSALGADEDSPMLYTRGHRASEKALERSGMPYTVLRPTGFMQGVGERLSDGSIYTCAEDGRVALVDARDIAAVGATALTEDGHQGRTYTLTGPEALTHDEMAATLSEVTGRQITHVRVSPEALTEAMTGAGLPQWLAEDLTTQFRVFEAGHGAEVSGDIAAVTGREPRSFAAYAREELTAAPAAADMAEPPDTRAVT